MLDKNALKNVKGFPLKTKKKKEKMKDIQEFKSMPHYLYN